MNKLYTRLLTLVLLTALFCTSNTTKAQGWPAQYGGVMLQGFYWDSFDDTRWSKLTSQADELAAYFSLVWIPQSGKAANSTSMGYDPKYYWDQNSTFGSEAQLRTLISALKAKGTGTIADVVINHRANVSNWVDFPAETYKGVTYQMVSTDICADDDGGECKKWADQNGYKLSPNKDSGEGWGGMRDLDHASENVQTIIKAYEKYLLEDLGYAGFRYDVAKGFAAKYFGIYNDAAKPQFSVGEYWDGNASNVKAWINGTKQNNTIMSAAFDFPFRYQVRDAVNGNNWSKVTTNSSLIYDKAYRRYSVTFIENHDTEKRKDANQDPIVKDTIAGNAVLLAMPGTPCVFLKHWQAYKKEIKLMIEARKMMGIHNESNYSVFGSAAQCTSIQVEGTNGNLIVVVGANAKGYTRGGYKELMSGYKYKYLVPESFDLTKWNQIVSRIEEEEKPLPFDPYTATLYVNVDQVNWTKVNFHTWGGTHAGTNWPGKVITDTKTIGGKTWYCQSFTMNAADDVINLVVSTGTGSPQTVDAVGMNQDTYLEVTTNQDGGKYTFKDVTNIYTGVESVITDIAPTDNRIFSINGQYLGISTSSLKPGLYIKGGKKIIVK